MLASGDVTDVGPSWDGRGLPPAAVARLARAKDSGVRTSLLAVDSQAGLDTAGFAPVGEVMGSTVLHLGWQGYAGCGWYGGGMGGFSMPFQVSTQVAAPGSGLAFAPYLDALDAGWKTAIGRMLAEARALGADGIVGVRLSEDRFEQGNREFLALGTAVRSLGQVHTNRPFATTLGGSDLAKLLRAGWVPAAVMVCLSLGIRHDDFRTRQSTFWSAGNIEVPGYTDLVTTVREANRRQISLRCAELGADGAVLTSPMRIQIEELEVGEGHTDHAAIASCIATALATFGDKSASSRSLVVLPLNGKGPR